MCDFDLHDALPCSDEKRSESSCFDTVEVHEKIIRLEEGLDLRVSVNRKTMQSVANLVLAANRMRKCLSHCGRNLTDGELCSVIMDNVVDETIVKTITNSSTGQRRVLFQRMNSGNQFTLCDYLQKDIVQESGALKLQAITLKGGNSQHKVNFKMSRYITTCVAPSDGQTIALSISNNLHISCSMKDDNAVLNLEECSKNDLVKISDDGNMDRFLFYKRTTGVSLTTFESVKYRGWFISTSSEDENQPVEMCKVDAASRLTSFKIN